MKLLHTALTAGAAVLLAMPLAAQAKLPPLSPEAKAKADETKAKADWSTKVAAYKLCLAQDRVADQYLKTAGKDKPEGGAPCADPGPYQAPTPPLEAAGAHSPTATATQPPSSNATKAELEAKPKK